MKIIAIISAILISVITTFTSTAADSSGPGRGGTGLTVFLDAVRYIDEDFVRQEIPIVTYVRDKELADVHIIISRHSVGNTGDTYNISFIGYGNYSDKNFQLNYWAPSANSSDMTRRGYTETIKRGLVPYISESPLAGMLSVSVRGNGGTPPPAPPADPWNNWVIELYGSINMSAESSRNNMSARYGFTAERITEESKIRFRPYANYSERNIKTNNGTVTRKTTRNGFDSYYIKGIGENWGVGIFVDLLSSSFDNYDYRLEAKPAVEYSFFPYREATRRSITLTWRAGAGYNNYIEETDFFKTSEMLYGQALTFSVNYRQPWGNLRMNVNGFHHFHDINSNRLDLSGSLNLRVVQGLGFNISSGYSRINDQRNIARRDLSLEDILLEQQRRSTAFSFRFDVGFTYTFGSKVTGIYNPRL